MNIHKHLEKRYKSPYINTSYSLNKDNKETLLPHHVLMTLGEEAKLLLLIYSIGSSQQTVII